MAGLPESLAGLAALVVVLIIWQLGRASLGSTLAHSDIRQEQSEALTRAVLDYVEGIGIAKTFNLLGERSAQLTENFARSRKVSIEFEESQAPWMRALYLVCGLGSVLIIPLSLWLYGRGQLSITFLLGVLLFVFDLFGPMKALYSQATRLTVMNACMDRIEAVLAQPELPDRGRESLPKAAVPRRWSSGMSPLPTGRKKCCMMSPSRWRKTGCWPWWGPPAAVKVR